MPSALSEEVVLFPENLLTAAAHPDPYPYYAALLAYCPFYREHRLGLWVALGAREVAEILSSQALRVRPPAEPVPAAIAGASAGEIFKNLVRMNDGPRHARAKSAVGACLGAIDTRFRHERQRRQHSRKSCTRGARIHNRRSPNCGWFCLVDGEL